MSLTDTERMDGTMLTSANDEDEDDDDQISLEKFDFNDLAENFQTNASTRVGQSFRILSITYNMGGNSVSIKDD